MFTILLLLLAIFFASCSHRQIEVVEHTTHDTLQQLQFLHDSTFISHDRTQEYKRATTPPTKTVSGSTLLPPDTILINEHSIEYRYRLLHDSIYITRVDTIPQVITIKERHGNYLPRSKLIKLAIIILALLYIIDISRERH